MAGSGQRFIDAGYQEPKPLIRLHDGRQDRRILEHVLDMFQDPSDRFVFVCNQEHLTGTGMEKLLLSLQPDASIISIQPHKKGPVFTVQAAEQKINDDQEVIVSYCDGAFPWNRQAFFHHVKSQNLDGCLFTHTGFHPHTLSQTRMAFLQQQDGLVTAIKEKACYTDNPLAEHASSGVYYFRKGAYVKKYFNELLEKNLHFNGEFYVTLVYNLMIRDGLRVGYFDTEHVAILGTPEEIKNFEAWSVLLSGAQVKTEAELIRCYHYWKTYHAKRK